MNAATINIFERPFQEVVDDILTAMVGGVVNEQIFFDVKEDLYLLSQPARDVRSIFGTRTTTVNGTPTSIRYAFQKEVDFVFSPAEKAVVWLPGGLKPDDETFFYVNYFRPDALSPLTDTNVGSVTRTLSEAIGREITIVYQQINQAYLAGFVDTATGQSLELVVSILGVVRKTKDFAVGLVTFFRDPAAGEGNVTIPARTLLRTAKGEATFFTTQERTLQRGQVRIDLTVRATDASKGSAGVRKAGEITTLAQPIAGIASVTNLDATVLGAKDETDEELRARAKAVLQGVGKATLAALAQVIFEERAFLDEVRDPNSPPAKQSDPGTVFLLVTTKPERFQNVQARVNETRAAGVQATVVARYVFFKPRLVASIKSGLTATGKIKLVGQVIDAMRQYTDELKSGEPAKGKDLIQAITKGVKELSDPKNIKIKAVITWRADIVKPGAETLTDALVEALAAVAPGDAAAQRAALENVLSQTAPPNFTERRIPDSSLLQGLTGQRPTDQEIESGDFQVVAVVNGENWTVVLDVEPADIFLAEH